MPLPTKARHDIWFQEMKDSGNYEVRSDGSVWTNKSCDWLRKGLPKTKTAEWRRADTSTVKSKRKVIRYKKKIILAHRFVYFWFNGVIPEDYVIDHIDGDCGNNHPSNLRAVTPEVNFQKAISNREITRKPGTSASMAVKNSWITRRAKKAKLDEPNRKL